MDEPTLEKQFECSKMSKTVTLSSGRDTLKFVEARLHIEQELSTLSG